MIATTAKYQDGKGLYLKATPEVKTRIGNYMAKHGIVSTTIMHTATVSLTQVLVSFIESICIYLIEAGS